MIYDTRFNENEWFVIALFVIGTGIIWLFPRRFSPTQTTFTMLFGITVGLIVDHTIQVPPFKLYDIGDRAKYEWFDVFSYVMYAPFGYWFIYWHERFRLSGFLTVAYIAFWTAIAIGVEWLGLKVGLFHYRNGYQILYSIPIYLFVQSLTLGLYRLVFAPSRYQKPRKSLEK
nr:hypothetical protein [Paenibacillus turpanensis]